MMFQGVPFNNGRTWPMKMLPPGALGTLPRPLSMLIVRHKPLKQCNSSNPAKLAAPSASSPPELSTQDMLAIPNITKPARSGRRLVLDSGSAAHLALTAGKRALFRLGNFRRTAQSRLNISNGVL